MDKNIDSSELTQHVPDEKPSQRPTIAQFNKILAEKSHSSEVPHGSFVELIANPNFLTENQRSELFSGMATELYKAKRPLPKNPVDLPKAYMELLQEDANNKKDQKAKSTIPPLERGAQAMVDTQEKTAIKQELQETVQDEIINAALARGRSTLSTYSIDTESQEGISGFQVVTEIGDPRRQLSKYYLNEQTTLEEGFPEFSALPGNLKADALNNKARNLQKDGIYEQVVIKPLAKDITKTRIIHTPVTGMFGITRMKDVEETYVTGQEPISLQEAIGKNDPDTAVKILYNASGVYSPNNDARFAYHDSAKRPGNSLTMELIIPEDIARKIATEIPRDPTFIRKVLESFVRNKYSNGFNEKVWNEWGRPPYEVWDNLTPQTKLLFTDKTQTAQSERGNQQVIPLSRKPSP